MFKRTPDSLLRANSAIYNIYSILLMDMYFQTTDEIVSQEKMLNLTEIKDISTKDGFADHFSQL